MSTDASPVFLTVRGQYLPSTLEGLRVLHNDTAGSQAGIAAANWAQWKFVNSQVLDPAAGFIFMTPPRPLDPFKVDIEDGYKAIYATDATFRESADAVITMPGKENPTQLAALRARGAKVLVYHGVSDAIFSASDTAAFMQRLDRALAAAPARAVAATMFFMFFM